MTDDLGWVAGFVAATDDLDWVAGFECLNLAGLNTPAPNTLTMSSRPRASETAASGAALQHLGRKLAELEQQCARLKQQKRVAEKFASTVQTRADEQAVEVAALVQQLEEARRRAVQQEHLAEQRLREVHSLRRAECSSFQTRVEHEVFRAVESTGNGRLFPYDLMPTMAAVQSKVAQAALQRRADRLADPDVHPSGLHPGVHEGGSCDGEGDERTFEPFNLPALTLDGLFI